MTPSPLVVYVVLWEFPHEGQEIMSVWSTEAAAEAEAERLNSQIEPGRSDIASHFVEPFVLDQSESERET